IPLPSVHSSRVFPLRTIARSAYNAPIPKNVLPTARSPIIAASPVRDVRVPESSRRFGHTQASHDTLRSEQRWLWRRDVGLRTRLSGRCEIYLQTPNARWL